MKKRLLITSIVMMLVVAVALSTATYAWFTSSAAVTASDITLKAASNTGAALGIGWDGVAYGTEIEAAGFSGLEVNPICPTALTKKTAQASGSDFSSIVWKTTTITGQSNGADVFGDVADAASTDRYVLSNTGAASTTVYLKNLSATNAITGVTLTADIQQQTADKNGSDLIRIGVFKKVGSTFELLDVMGVSGQKVTIGTPVKGQTAAQASVDSTSYTVVNATTGIDVTFGAGLAANTAMELKIVIWMDGLALNDAKSGFDAQIDFTFTAANANS